MIHGWGHDVGWQNLIWTVFCIVYPWNQNSLQCWNDGQVKSTLIAPFHLEVPHHVQVNTKYEVSITIYMDMRANQRKIPKWLPFKNYKSE